MEQPELGWTTVVTPIRVIDGDTVEVEIRKRVTVRLMDDDGTYDTPEIRRPASNEEILLGVEASKELEVILNNSDVVILHVPTEIDGNIQDIFSIGSRIVGHLFADGDSVSEIMAREGYDKSKENYLGK